MAKTLTVEIVKSMVRNKWLGPLMGADRELINLEMYLSRRADGPGPAGTCRKRGQK